MIDDKTFQDQVCCFLNVSGPLINICIVPTSTSNETIVPSNGLPTTASIPNFRNIFSHSTLKLYQYVHGAQTTFYSSTEFLELSTKRLHHFYGNKRTRDEKHLTEILNNKEYRSNALVPNTRLNKIGCFLCNDFGVLLYSLVVCAESSNHYD